MKKENHKSSLLMNSQTEPSDKSSPPQPSDKSKSSLFHLCLPKPPPNHTPELTTIEFAGAVRENELRKPTALRQKLPPSSIFACPNLHHITPHHTLELTATEFVGAVCRAWKQTRAIVSHDTKVCFSWFSLFPNLDFELLMSFFGFMGFFGA